MLLISCPSLFLDKEALIYIIGLHALIFYCTYSVLQLTAAAVIPSITFILLFAGLKIGIFMFIIIYILTFDFRPLFIKLISI